MSQFIPPSLLQHFVPPDDYTGTFCWLTGYSADASFLAAAAERFTQQTNGQRAAQGAVAIVALLDKGQKQINSTDAPGVLHVPLTQKRNFVLLHAKVALLRFRHVDSPEKWCLRLLVSTGNWTRQTLENSLDLAWSITLFSEELRSSEVAYRQARADVVAGWKLFEWLMPLFDLSALYAEPYSLTTIAREQLRLSCDGLATRGLPKPRFFDSRKKSLLAQVLERAPLPSPTRMANRLIMGSGFFETGTGTGVPVVLAKIASDLKQRGLLHRHCEVDVIAEPTDCQAVSTSLAAMNALGWRIRPPGQPHFLGNVSRRLHAKFIFAGRRRKGSRACLDAWLYLGSGNLTAPGFLAGCPSGNLEAGLVITDDSLEWKKVRGMAPAAWLENRLPVQFMDEIVDPGDLATGPGMPDRPTAFLAPPVSWCRYVAASDDSVACLLLPDHVLPVEILDTELQACVRLGPQSVAWPGEQQPSVTVRWQENGVVNQCSIPVIDAAGRIAAMSLPQLDLESAWFQLQQFPNAPAEEDSEGDAREFDHNDTPPAARHSIASDSGIRAMMRLIENVAHKQSGISLADWDAWCVSLEQALRQAAHCGAVEAFAAEVALNPLIVLGQPCSLPAFAHEVESPQNKRLQRLLSDVAGCWGVVDMASGADF